MPTITPKRLIATLALAPTLASAQVDFDWWDFKEWRQVGPTSTIYLGGFTDVFFQDGSWELAPCLDHPSPAIVPPYIFCPLGTTGFIAQGDVDFDGVNDQGSFWSVAAVTRAELVEPFRTDQFLVASAPPSGFADKLRASGGDLREIFTVIDTSVVIWYNVLAPPVDDYEINRFEAHNHYGEGNEELKRHYNDVVWGTYQFTLPQLETLRPVPFAVTHIVTPEVYPGRGAVPQGWLVTNDNWIGDEIHVDPRTFFQFEWFGLNFQNTLPTDLLFLSMRANQYLDLNGMPRVEIVPETIVSGTITGVSCNTIETDVNFDEFLTQGSTYEFNITSGDLNQTTEYPINTFGTGGGLDSGELMTPNDLSGGVVSGTITAANGLTLTTSRDLAGCLVGGNTYELEFVTGALAGSTQFPISAWGAPGTMDLTTLVDVSASVAPGDIFRLNPREVLVTSTIQTVAGSFVEGDLNMSNLVPGGDYRIEVLTGASAGSSIQVTNYGFPTNFWFETDPGYGGGLAAGDTYQLNFVTPPPNRIKIGDTFTISQNFVDWQAEKVAAGEMTPGAALEDVIVFPPYPIATPPGDRDEFLLGTFQGEYELGPFFFQPGDNVTARLNLDRSIPAGQATTDNVNRILNWHVRFIDTYEGFAILGGLSNEGFPFGTPSSQRAPGLDYDRDGASNVLEFAMQTDVADPNDKPAFQFALGDQPGQCTATITKRPFIGERLVYRFEYSTNLVDWTTIMPGNLNFDIVVDNETTLTVSNVNAVNGAFPPPSCFLRLRVELN